MLNENLQQTLEISEKINYPKNLALDEIEKWFNRKKLGRIYKEYEEFNLIGKIHVKLLEEDSSKLLEEKEEEKDRPIFEVGESSKANEKK